MWIKLLCSPSKKLYAFDARAGDYVETDEVVGNDLVARGCGEVFTPGVLCVHSLRKKLGPKIQVLPVEEPRAKAPAKVAKAKPGRDNGTADKGRNSPS